MGAVVREGPKVGSWASSPSRRALMQANRGRDTGPELYLRSLLHRRGLRYRVHVRPLVGLRRTADIVHRPTKVAVFVDGCFWHGCPEHYVEPRTNESYWVPKIEANIRRDRETDAALVNAGWTVFRVWEHEDPSAAADRVIAAVEQRRRV